MQQITIPQVRKTRRLNLDMVQTPIVDGLILENSVVDRIFLTLPVRTTC
jgi:hypothetical protein